MVERADYSAPSTMLSKALSYDATTWKFPVLGNILYDATRTDGLLLDTLVLLWYDFASWY